MREILFRGKDTVNGEWRFGFLVSENNIGNWVDCDPVLPSTVGQFTGLTDKNGKKIFEGDVLEWYMGGKNETPTYGYVVFDEADLSWCVKYQRYDPDYLSNLESQHISVVGNIYDNPEFTD